MRSYCADVALVDACCREHGQIALASQATDFAFLKEQGCRLAPGQVQRGLSAIGKIYSLLKLPDPTRDEELLRICRRIARGRTPRPG